MAAFPVVCIVYLYLCYKYKKRPPDAKDDKKDKKTDTGTELTDVQKHGFVRDVQQALAPA